MEHPGVCSSVGQKYGYPPKNRKERLFNIILVGSFGGGGGGGANQKF